MPHGPLTVAPPRAADRAAISAGGMVGIASAVPWARNVEYVVLAAEGHLALANVAHAVARHDVNTAGEPRDGIDLTRAALIAATPLKDAEQIVEAEGALLRAAQMAGALARVLDLSLVWVTERVQFGKPIAKFQAIQHAMAQLAAEAAAASAAADMAVEASSGGPDRFTIAVAKARIGEAAGKAAGIAHQVFGAMGFTREHPLHYATRRLWSWRDEFGSEVFWQAEIGRGAAERGADALWPSLAERG
jgi:acyl-CoA dehydrogenase